MRPTNACRDAIMTSPSNSFTVAPAEDLTGRKISGESVVEVVGFSTLKCFVVVFEYHRVTLESWRYRSIAFVTSLSS